MAQHTMERERCKVTNLLRKRKNVDIAKVLGALGPDDLERSRDPDWLDEQCISQDNVPDVLALALTPPKSEQDFESKTDQAAQVPEASASRLAKATFWPAIHALQVLEYLEVEEEELLKFVPFLGSEDDWRSLAVAQFMFSHGELVLQSNLIYQYARRWATPACQLRFIRVVTTIGSEVEELFEGACALLVALLGDLNDRTMNGHILRELKLLHGCAQLDIEDEDEDFEQALRTPSPKTVEAVRQRFVDKKIDPCIAGGFIDFLESAVLPVDPDDLIVQDLEANTWMTSEDNEEEVKEVHQGRLEEIRKEWIALHQKKRASQVSAIINKAVMLFLVLLVYQVLNSQYGPLPAITRALKRRHDGEL